MMNKKYTFEDFVLYEGNELAHAALHEVSIHPDKPLSPLYIYGSTGLGKTHLVNAAAEQLSEIGKVSYIVITTAERFKSEYIHALRMQSLADFYAKYECADVLIMENFQQLSGRGELQALFHEIFDTLQENGKQVILTSDVPSDYLMDFDSSLLSKVRSGYVVEIEAPGYEDRIAILEDEMDSILVTTRMDADEEELDQIISYIANFETSDIRKMKGMLIRVASFALLLNEELTFAFAARILRVQSR